MEAINEFASDEMEFNKIVHFYVNKGFSIISQGDNDLILKKNYFGEVLVHIILLVFTVWILFGFANLIYFLIAYYLKSVSVHVFLSPNNSNNNFDYCDDKFNCSDINYITTFLESDLVDESLEFNDDDVSLILDYLENN